jgi:hypothetical protein
MKITNEFAPSSPDSELSLTPVLIITRPSSTNKTSAAMSTNFSQCPGLPSARLKRATAERLATVRRVRFFFLARLEVVELVLRHIIMYMS